MIEMVYSGKDSQEQGDVKIPKNIRQIGTNQSHKKIYIEDYVMTYLKKKTAKEDDLKYGVLLGEVKKSKGNSYIFVKGMIEVFDVIENSLIFNDDIWAGLYKDMKQYFEKLEIVGWFVSVPYRVSDDMNGIRKIHLDNFAGNDKVCFLNDRTEKEEGFYIYEQGNLTKQSGYYIYYEKNEKMKKYVKNCNNRAKEIVDENKKNKRLEVTEGKQITQKTDESQQSSGLLKSIKDNKVQVQGRFAYGVSGLLIVALLLSTVVMLNNYGELKNIKNTLTGLEVNQQAKEVSAMLNAYSDKDEKSDEETKEQNENQEEITDTESDDNAEEVTDNKEDNEGDNTDDIDTEEDEDEDLDEEAETDKAVTTSYSGKKLKVKAGQTLYDISIKYYGTSKMVDDIKDYNDIDDDYTIIEGQEILLP